MQMLQEEPAAVVDTGYAGGDDDGEAEAVEEFHPVGGLTPYRCTRGTQFSSHAVWQGAQNIRAE